MEIEEGFLTVIETHPDSGSSPDRHHPVPSRTRRDRQALRPYPLWQSRRTRPSGTLRVTTCSSGQPTPGVDIVALMESDHEQECADHKRHVHNLCVLADERRIPDRHQDSIVGAVGCCPSFSLQPWTSSLRRLSSKPERRSSQVGLSRPVGSGTRGRVSSTC